MRTAVTAAALVVLMGLVGSVVFLAVREEDRPPTTTTTTTTTTVPIAEVASAIAIALQNDFDETITRTEARCVANELLAVMAPADLEAFTSLTAGLVTLDSAQRDRLVRGIIGCLTPAAAAVLLASPTTTTIPPAELPDEGG